MSWFKISSAIFAFSSFQFLALCQAPPVVINPQPPAVKSETGYLTVSADIEIPPEFPKMFVAPQTTLPIMEDSGESYVFLVNVDSFAICCRIPKYQKFMVLTELSKDRNSIYFRGGIEAEVSPFKIFSGEELPIIGEDSKNYFVSVLSRKSNMTVKLPKAGRFRGSTELTEVQNRSLKTDGSASRPYLEFANFAIGSLIKTFGD